MSVCLFKMRQEFKQVCTCYLGCIHNLLHLVNESVNFIIIIKLFQIYFNNTYLMYNIVNILNNIIVIN